MRPKRKPRPKRKRRSSHHRGGRCPATPQARLPLLLMISAAQMTADMRVAFAEIPQTITLASGQSVSATVTSGPESDALSMADVDAERKLTAIVLVADCTRAPAQNDVIAYGGKSYRITDVTPHDDGLAYTIQAAGEWQ